METIDYTKRYNEIPRNYKHEVLKISDSHKPDIHFLLNGTDGKVGEEKAERIRNAINQVWRPHKLAKLIDVRPKRKIVVESPTEIIYLEYTELMKFQISITGTIGDHETEHELIHSARDEYENLNNKNPYKLKLLIAKYIINGNNN